MAEEKKTVKAATAPKKAPAPKKEAAPAKEVAPKKETAPKKDVAPVKEAAPKKDATPAKAAAPKAKAAGGKKGAPMMINNRVVVQSKAPLYSAQHKKGAAPYAISKEQVKVTLVKSTIGSIEVHIRTVEALGLKKIGQSKVFKKSPALDGMLFRVRHLIKVEEVK